jgi:hypothetical protein
MFMRPDIFFIKILKVSKRFHSLANDRVFDFLVHRQIPKLNWITHNFVNPNQHLNDLSIPNIQTSKFIFTQVFIDFQNPLQLRQVL